jgi:hypothetical protein
VFRVPSLVEGDAGKEAFVGYLGSGKGKEGKGVGVTAHIDAGGVWRGGECEVGT